MSLARNFPLGGIEFSQVRREKAVCFLDRELKFTELRLLDNCIYTVSATGSRYSSVKLLARSVGYEIQYCNEFDDIEMDSQRINASVRSKGVRIEISYTQDCWMERGKNTAQRKRESKLSNEFTRFSLFSVEWMERERERVKLGLEMKTMEHHGTAREAESQYHFNSSSHETSRIREAQGWASTAAEPGYSPLTFRRDEYLAVVLENVKTPRRRATVR